MRFAVYLPWLLALLVGLPGVAAVIRGLPDRLDPRPVLVVLTASLAALAAVTTTSLVLLISAGATALGVTGPLSSPDGHADPGALPVGLVAAVALALALGRVARAGLLRSRRRRRVRSAVVGAGTSVVDEAVLVESDAVFAVATPPGRSSPGRVVVSRGMWSVLDERERAAVVAHEQEHLDGAHHAYLGVAALAIALNPLLAGWWDDVVHCAERCADEGAARRLSDRGVVARAVGRAALSARSRRGPPAMPHRVLTDPTVALGVTTGSVPRRVSALLAGWHRARVPGRHVAPALLVAALLVTGVALAGAGALHAAWDLHHLLGALGS